MRRRSYLINDRKSFKGVVIATIALFAVIGALLGVYEIRDKSIPVNDSISNESVDVSLPNDILSGTPLILDTNEDFGKVKVILDGWSNKILNGRRLGVELDDDRVGALNFKAATLDDVKSILSLSPETIEQAFARLIDGDQRITCTVSACSIDGRALDLSYLVNPAESSWLGGVYKGWGITNGLYIADINIPSSSQFFKVTGEGVQHVDLVNSFGAGGDIYSGYGKGIYYIGLAWGVLFPVDVRWLQSEEGAGDARKNIRRGLQGDQTGESFLGESLFAGPADYNGREVALSLNTSQITYYSSPVTGCGTLSICTPVLIDYQVNDGKGVSGTVCDSSGKGTLSIKNYSIELNLPSFTHIGGGWSGESNIFDGEYNASSVLGFYGKAPLIKGKNTLYLVSAELSDSLGLVATAGGRSLKEIAPFGLERLGDLFGGELVKC
ncbi:MAG: hypothetical protein ACKOW9_00550 [Candidatus Paceibacterota bacterium]